MILDRHDKIIKLLEVHRKITIDELKRELNVSIETIRRDLKALEEQNLLRRVYGGAVLNSMTSAEPMYTTREALNMEEKRRIAKKTAELINDGDTIAIDIGTTVLEATRHLTGKNNLTVLTNSINAAQQLASNPTNKVYVLGGMLRWGENATSGYIGEQALDHFRVDKTLLGVGGFTIEDGVTDYMESEAQVRKKMISIAKQTIAVADYSKFGVTAFCKICDITQIHTLVTDARAPKTTLAQLKGMSLDVIVAE